jgi:hypothetical protein
MSKFKKIALITGALTLTMSITALATSFAEQQPNGAIIHGSTTDSRSVQFGCIVSGSSDSGINNGSGYVYVDQLAWSGTRSVYDNHVNGYNYISYNHDYTTGMGVTKLDGTHIIDTGLGSTTRYTYAY